MNVGLLLLKISIVLIISLLFWLLSFYIKYFDIIKWYYNESKDGSCNKKFSIVLFLLSYENAIMYSIFSKFYSNRMNDLNRQQMKFINKACMTKIRRTTTDGRKVGFIKPRHLCVSLKLKEGDSDNFDRFIVATGLDPEKPAVFDGDGNRSEGVYPATPDGAATSDWKTLIEKWCGKKWEVVKVQDDNIYKPYTIDSEHVERDMDIKVKVYETWYDNVLHPDNFFALNEISPDSPIVIAFYNGNYNYGSIVINANAVNNLLGPNYYSGDVSGFLGFTINFGENVSYDEYMNFLYTKISSDITTFRPEKKKCEVNSFLGSSIAAGFSGATAAGSLPLFIMSGPGAIPAAIGMGLIGGLFSSLGSVPDECRENNSFLSLFGGG